MQRQQAHYHPNLADPCEHGELPTWRESQEESPAWTVFLLAAFLLLSWALLLAAITSLRP